MRLRINDINNIEASSHGNVLSCLQKVLEYWLKKDYDYGAHGVPCWRVMCVAIKEGGGDPALAEEIAREHLLPATTLKRSTGNCYEHNALLTQFLLPLNLNTPQVTVKK